jgi:ionotropic glutamate receptor
MNLVWRVSIFTLCIGAFSVGALRPDVVQVGAIFTFSTINGKVAKIAMKAAEDDVNSDPSILGGSKLLIRMHDSNFSGFLGIIGGKLFYYLFCKYSLPVLILAVSLLFNLFYFFLFWVVYLV